MNFFKRDCMLKGLKRNSILKSGCKSAFNSHLEILDPARNIDLINWSSSTDSVKKTFSYMGAVLCNNLDNSVRTATSDKFKKQLKTFFFKKFTTLDFNYKNDNSFL